MQTTIEAAKPVESLLPNGKPPVWTRAAVKLLAHPRLGGRAWYQQIELGRGIVTGDWVGPKAERARHRTRSFLEFLAAYPFRPDDVVVDVGCNAGLFSLVAGTRCHKVTGIEYDKAFYRQARLVRRVWSARGGSVANVHLEHGDITERSDVFSDATVVFASKVLYHKNLGDGVYRIMGSIERSPVRDILIQGHVTQGELGDDAGVARLVADHGFTLRTVLDDPEYPIAVASRNGGTE